MSQRSTSTLPPRSPSLRGTPPMPPRRPTLWSFFLMGFLAATAATGGGLLAYYLPRQVLPTALSSDELAAFRPDALRSASLDHSLHILVLGVDQPPPSQTPVSWQESLQSRSDTMLLIRFDPVADRISLLSIPRDTLVRFPNRAIGKINAANAIGGPALAARTVGELLGDVPIDRYVRLNTEGIAALINAVGGVDIFVPYKMKYIDHTQKLNIDLGAGWQHLNGEQAHGFLRFRHDELGDIGRVQRQQELMRSLSHQLLQPQTVTQIPQILQVIREYVDTNLKWEEVISLAQFLLRSPQDRLDMMLLPGRFGQSSEGAAGYWIPDRQATVVLGTRVFSHEPAPATEPIPQAYLRIAVQNASGTPGTARRVVKALIQQGFGNVFTVEDHAQILPTTSILAQQGDPQSARTVQEKLGLGEVRVESTGILNTDVTIQVGTDWVSQHPTLTP